MSLSVTFPPREYLPFKDEPYKIDLRFDRITPDDIFEIDEGYAADMKRKRHMLATRPADLLLPGVPGVNPVTPAKAMHLHTIAVFISHFIVPSSIGDELGTRELGLHVLHTVHNVPVDQSSCTEPLVHRAPTL